MTQPEILTPDVEVLDLDEQISTALVKHNITDAVISELKARYGGLKLKDVNDKQGYLEIKDARKEVRKWGVLTEKITKKGREDAIAIQKKWLAKEKEILGKIAEVQDLLDAEIKKYDDEQERIEQERQRKIEEAFAARQASLFRMGATFSNGSYNLGEISYESNLIKESDESMWNDVILPKYTKVYERVEAERVEQERQRKEQEEKLRKQQEELAEQQRLFKEQQEAFQKQQAELQRQKDEAERQQREALLRQEMEEKEKRNQLIRKRCNQLQALGMTFNDQYDAYVFEDVNVDNKTEICLLDDAQWSALISKITPVIEQRKQDAEQKRLAEIEEQKRIAAEAAAKAERERIEQEKKDAEIKKQQELQRQQEELARANDKTKWESVLQQINAITFPEFKSGIYKGKMAILREKIEEINQL